MQENDTRSRIKIQKDGSYKVTGNVPLSKQAVVYGEDGVPVGYEMVNEYPLQPEYHLCRCGKSSNKPFCDGTHAKVEFDGTEVAPKKRNFKRLSGPTLILHDDEGLCYGPGFCHLAGGTWELTGKSDNPRARELAIRTAKLCPSGRLVMEDRATGEFYEHEYSPSIILVEDYKAGVSGPILIRGNIIIESADGEEYQTCNRAALCRCGSSRNKPFCDGMHEVTGFHDDK